MKISAIAFKAVLTAAVLCFSTSSHASFVEGFDSATLPAGWVATNLSTRASTGNPWATGDGITDENGNIIVAPQSGAGFAIANYTSVGSGSGTISNWLISPLITGMKNGDTFSFYTTTTPASDYPDRLEFRMSNTDSTNVGTTTTSVGTFTTALLTINPTLAVGGYPEDWTLYSVTLSGLTAPVNGRVAFRYFVTSGGPTGANSNVIGVDNFSYTSAAVNAVPEPGSVTLVLAGMGVIAGLQRRRRQAGSAA